MPRNHALEESEDREDLRENSAQASQNVIEIVETVKIGYNFRNGIPKISLVPDEEYLNEKIKEDIFRLFNKIETPEERKKLISELQESFANSAKDHEHMSVPLWKNRTTGRDVSPADWIRMHYGREAEDGTWDADGLTRAEIKQVDPELYNAYSQQVRRNPETAIPELLSEARMPRDSDPAKVLEERRRRDRERKALKAG